MPNTDHIPVQRCVDFPLRGSALGPNLRRYCSACSVGATFLGPMSENQIATQIAESLLSAGARADSVNEEPLLVIREIAPYPALFRAEIRRRFGVQLQQTCLDMTIDELASLIHRTPQNN